jgi:hypothetical protein
LVGATPAPGDTGDVVFETEMDLETTPAAIDSVFVREPDGDRCADVTASATGSGDPYPVFTAAAVVDHRLYLAADAVLSPAPKDGVEVQMLFDAATDDANLWHLMNTDTVPLMDWSYYDDYPPEQPVVVWEYYDGKLAQWTKLPSAVPQLVDAGTWKMTFPIPDTLAAVSVNGQHARWIRASLSAWPASTTPVTLGVTVRAAGEVTASAPPDIAFFNVVPIDLGKDFYPLGQQPVYSDAFYVGSQGVLSRAAAGTSVTLAVTVSEGYAGRKSTDLPTITWEIWTGDAWTEIGRTGWNSGGTALTSSAVTDGSNALTRSGDVVLTLSKAIVPCAVSGITSYWIRARLVQGGYGTGVVISADGTSVSNDGYRPPILSSVSLSCASTPSAAPTCLRYDDLVFTDCTSEASFPIFVRAKDESPALYVGFDQAFGNQSMALYVSVAPLSASGGTAEPTAPPEVDWEYWNGRTWALLGAADGTRRFALSGLVRFIGPADLAPREELGKTLHWIRARLAQGGYAVEPRAGRLSTNTTYGVQATTVTGEVLGSSNHTPRQAFALSQTPVLGGQQIEVLELVDPSPEEAWVRWTEVPNFDLSGPGDRHYTFDFSTGQVRFGDGTHGMVPPGGNGNVRAAWYRAGGGSQGNRAAGTVNQMKTAVTYVSGVTNHEPATGGADAESLAEVADRGPRILRHRERAVCAQDFEDLAVEASTEVAKVTAVSTPYQAKTAGRVAVLLVPHGTEPMPSPGLGLLQEVGAHLRARAAPAVQLQLSGPRWLEASVRDLTVIPLAMTRADALRATILDALDAFFHPLTGGFDGRGWEFAELPTTSDVCRLVASIPGVDAVESLNLAFEPVDRSLFDDPDNISEDTVNESLEGALICSGKHHVRIVPRNGGA